MIKNKYNSVMVESIISDIIINTINDIYGSGAVDTYAIILDFIEEIGTLDTCLFLQKETANILNEYINNNPSDDAQKKIFSFLSVLVRRINSCLTTGDYTNGRRVTYLDYMLEMNTECELSSPGVRKIEDELLDRKVVASLKSDILKDVLKENQWFLVCYSININVLTILLELKNNKVDAVGGKE